MAPSTVNFDSAELGRLLDESQEFLDEAKRAEDQEGEEDTWFKKFSANIKERVGNAENLGEMVLNNLKSLKLRASPRLEEEDSSQRSCTVMAGVKYAKDLGKVPDTSGKTILATNLLLRVTRRVQNVVNHHGLALNFLQKVINNLEERLSEVELKVNVDKGWLEAEVENKLSPVKVKVEELEKEKVRLAQEVDEARQRGMKGNLILSTRPDKKSLLKPVRVDAVMQSPTQMCLKAIKDKTGATFSESDVLACHALGNKENPKYIVKILNWKSHAWETLVTGMVNPKKDEYFDNNGLFISFQLTPLRQEILQNVRKARTLKHIGKFKVDSNGRIFASKTKGKPGVKEPLPWKEIFNLDILSTLCDGAVMPLVIRNERPARARQ